MRSAGFWISIAERKQNKTCDALTIQVTAALSYKLHDVDTNPAYNGSFSSSFYSSKSHLLQLDADEERTALLFSYEMSLDWIGRNGFAGIQ